mgnify:CR=1 FL=1
MRGSKPGERRGGRQKGTPNRRTLEIEERLVAVGCHPLEAMARLAMDESNSPELRGKLLAELAGFIAPKRRAVEHTGADGGQEDRHADQVGRGVGHGPAPSRGGRPVAWVVAAMTAVPSSRRSRRIASSAS